MVEKFYSRVIRKVLHVVQQHVQEDSEIPLNDSTFDSLQRMNPQALAASEPMMNQQGQEFVENYPFMKLDKDLIRGDFNFTIVSGSTAADSDTQRAVKAKSLFDFAMTNPLIDRVEATKVILELGGFEEYIGRLLRNPEEVKQEAMMKAKERLQVELALDKPKRDTDLKKTQMKSMTALETERMRQQGESGRDTETNQVKLIDSILDAAKERSTSNGS